METLWGHEIYRDEDGNRYIVLATVPYDNINVEYRQYQCNSRSLKAAGGKYALHCPETGVTKHFRSDYMAMHSLSKFVKDNSK